MLNCELADVIEIAFYSQWDMVTINLHYAGALLNPYLLHDKELANNSNSLTGCKTVLQKLCPPETYPNVV
jgi:hypothetical protein